MRFYQISDLHYYPAKAMNAKGSEWQTRAKYDQKCLAESDAIINAAVDFILKDDSTDIVLVSGDNVSDGERVGHYELRKKLHRLTAAGKRVFLITGTHDLHPEPKGYSEQEGEYIAEGCTRDELIEIYGEFGYNDAVATHKDTFSYVAMLDEHTRLLALNDDGIGFEDGFHGYFEDQLSWIKSQLEEGKANNDRMIVMGHHPLLAPNPFYALYCKDRQMLGDCDKIARLFADYGVQFMFTGHTHMQSINSFDTPKGNRIYDINTGSLTAYPSPIRHMELTDKELRIKTLHLSHIDYDLHGVPYMIYSREHFDFMLKDILYSAAHDIDRFCELSESFSLPKETARKFSAVILILGKILDTLTFKKAGTILCCKNKIAPRMYNVRLADFIIDLVRNMYAGDEPYAPGTAEYDSFMAIYHRISPLVHKITGNDDIDRIIEGVLYDGGWPDNDAVLPVVEYKK